MDEEQISQIAKQAADELWGRLLNKLTSDETLSDEAFGRKYLFNQRRIAFKNVLELVMQYEISMSEIEKHKSREPNFTGDDGKEAFNKKMEALTRESATISRQIEVWESRIQAVVKAEVQNFSGKIIEENYGDFDSAQGSQEASAA